MIRRAHPDLAPAIDESIDELEQAGLTLVHGDFSPKNVLVPAGADREPWVIDFEVVHVGHPVFDVAFLISHLILKAIHLPDRRAEIDVARAAFLARYEADIDDVLRSAATRRSAARPRACCWPASTANRRRRTSPPANATSCEDSRSTYGELRPAKPPSRNSPGAGVSPMTARIAHVTAWEALDSRGRPTVAARLELADGTAATAHAPSGASAGSHEVRKELRDGGKATGRSTPGDLTVAARCV